MDLKSWHKYYGKPLSVIDHRSKAISTVPSALQAIAKNAGKTLIAFCDNDSWEAWMEEEDDPNIVARGSDPWRACIKLLLRYQTKYGFDLEAILPVKNKV